MTDLDELKKKWFLDLDDTTAFPPQRRHRRGLVSDHTDGNQLEPLLSGAAMMAEFHQQVSAMIDDTDPSAHELWVSSWKIEPTKLLGTDVDGPDAEELIVAPTQAGVDVRWLGSGHILAHRKARRFASRVVDAGDAARG